MLIDELCKLVYGFDEGLMELLEKLLDPTQETDKAILDEVTKELAVHRGHQDKKSALNELDPIKTEYDVIDKYFRVQQENLAELRRAASKKSIMSTIAKNISVIRGSAFKLEGNERISKMGAVGVSQRMDRRYFLNPDKYNWEFRNYFTSPQASEE